jgi:dinuclear metal center YbgI/SA1388 family protein
MKLAQLIAAIEAFAPLDLAADWDNVGLLMGSPEDAISGPVLMTIDLTSAVLQEAAQHKASAVIAYHPPIFHPIKRLTDTDPVERTLLRAARMGLAIYSPHTALDAAPGAMSDWLADAILDAPATRAGGGDRRAIIPREALAVGAQVKIVTFIPTDRADAVRSALASAGAGKIGKYEVCSFAAAGTGTFFGTEGTTPTVGRVGRLEAVPEVRLEMVCSRRALAIAIETLRRFHPYEEPAIDVYPLHPQPTRAAGPGRKLTLDRATPLSALADRLKKHLRLPQVRVASAGSRGLQQPITHVGVCPGAGGSLAEAALKLGCEVFVTGEMKHHEVLAALRHGMSVILAGHTNTERGYLPVLAERLKAALPGQGLEFVFSQVDHDPLAAV